MSFCEIAPKMQSCFSENTLYVTCETAETDIINIFCGLCHIHNLAKLKLLFKTTPYLMLCKIRVRKVCISSPVMTAELFYIVTFFKSRSRGTVRWGLKTSTSAGWNLDHSACNIETQAKIFNLLKPI